jgi:hypothetical protein
MLAAAAAISFLIVGHAMPARAQSATFGGPVAVGDSRPGGEPGIIADNAGGIFVNAPPGLPGPSNVWRSTDGGATFTFAGPGTVGAWPNGVGVAIGGGDSNLASDASIASTSSIYGWEIPRPQFRTIAV